VVLDPVEVGSNAPERWIVAEAGERPTWRCRELLLEQEVPQAIDPGVEDRVVHFSLRASNSDQICAAVPGAGLGEKLVEEIVADPLARTLVVYTAVPGFMHLVVQGPV